MTTKKPEEEIVTESADVDTQLEENVQEAEKLPLRDALEVAVIAANDAPEAPAKRDAGLQVEYRGKRGAGAKDAAGTGATEPPAAPPSLQPPGEWTAEEKADFSASSRKSQEAALRLHKHRGQTLEEIKREKADLQWAKDLAKEVEPFLKVRGEKGPAYNQLINAVKMANEIDGNAKQAVAAILQAKGLKIPKELLEEEGGNTSPAHPELASLRNELDQLKMRTAREDYAKAVQPVVQFMTEFSNAKNAAGGPKYPSFRMDDTSEEGLRFASSFGSLVSGHNELSKQFIANLKARIPNLTHAQLYHEAYVFAGGKVADAETARTHSPQKHINQSNRAASSVPGNNANTGNAGREKKFKTTREAAAAALAQLRETEAH